MNQQGWSWAIRCGRELDQPGFDPQEQLNDHQKGQETSRVDQCVLCRAGQSRTILDQPDHGGHHGKGDQQVYAGAQGKVRVPDHGTENDLQVYQGRCQQRPAPQPDVASGRGRRRYSGRPAAGGE